jgi:hypothetical protein
MIECQLTKGVKMSEMNVAELLERYEVDTAEAYRRGAAAELDRCVTILEEMARKAMRDGDEASHRTPNGGTFYYIKESTLRDAAARIRHPSPPSASGG